MPWPFRRKARTERIAQVASAEEADRLVIQQLVSLGANLSLPRSVRHYLYLPERQAAEKAAEQLRPDGFNVDVQHGDDSTSWLVLAEHLAVVSPDGIAALRASLMALVEASGGEYDGWEASPEP